MPLSVKIQSQSLEALMAGYPKKKLTPEVVERLKAINTLAADNNVNLSAQSREVIALVREQLGKSSPKSSGLIYSMVMEQMDRETNENKRQHSAQGRFDKKNIHQRGLHDQLQDHDMTLLMPKPHKNIEVLAPMNRFDRSTEAVQEGIVKALNNEKIKHIMLPAGPGHWRGVYLSKPDVPKGKYHLELFDPYGPIGAEAIQETILGLLKKCGIDRNQITIKFTGPEHPQQDIYACGDFTCAHSHQKMKALGASDTAYNQDLITVLERQGNAQDALRHASREVTRALPEPQVAAPVIPAAPVVETPAQPTKSKLTAQEERIFTTTISAQKAPSTTYKDEIALLIKSRQSIFAQADAAIKKEGLAQPLNDEELAAKLQAEEFSNAGFKPK